MKPAVALAIARKENVSTQNDLRTCYISLKRIAENPHACTCVREFSWYGEGHNDGCPVAQALFALTPEQRRMVRAAKKILGD